METTMTDEPTADATDRYVSFAGIDCDGKARRMMERIDLHLAMPERNNLFWQYFSKKRAGGSGPKPDDLFLLHSHINQVRELFETWEDEEALRMLDHLEEKCC
jgi:hypothetical protein